MKKLHLAGALLACLCGSANASLYEIIATSTTFWFTDFTLIYNDTSDDNLLQFDEVMHFSGVTASGVSSTFDGFYGIITGTPDIAGISTASGQIPSNGAWGFIKVVGDPVNCCSQDLWTYTVSAVPLPATAWLLGSGLLGLTGISRRWKAA